MTLNFSRTWSWSRRTAGRAAIFFILGSAALLSQSDARDGSGLEIISADGGSLIQLSWPAEINEAILEQSRDLKHPQAWRIGSRAPELSGGRYVLELPYESRDQFFRLNLNPVIFVDAAADPGGDGSAAAPFQTIAEGLGEATTRFAQSGRGQTLYVIANDYPERIALDGSAQPGLDITVLSSRFPLTIDGQMLGGDQRARLTAPSGQAAVDVRDCERFSLIGFEAVGTNAAAMRAEDISRLNVQDSTLTASGGPNGLFLTNIEDGSVTFSGITISGTSQSGVAMDSYSGTFLLSDLDDNADDDILTVDGTGPGFAGLHIANSGDGDFTFANSDIKNTGAEGVLIDAAGTVRFGTSGSGYGNVIGVTSINGTSGDAIRSSNTDIVVTFADIGIDALIAGDGIAITNSDGQTHTADIIFNNIFGLGSPDPSGRGIFLNAQNGTLIARLDANLISTAQTTIATVDGGAARSLVLDLIGNSTLSTAMAQPVMSFVGSGTHSTIVQNWDGPNQVIGGFTQSSGILFDRITFDSDGDPANGFQQVEFSRTELRIGQVPPFSIVRVEGNGLTFLEPGGSLRIDVLEIANQNGTGLFVGSPGPGFNLEIGTRTIDTINGSESNYP